MKAVLRKIYKAVIRVRLPVFWPISLLVRCLYKSGIFISDLLIILKKIFFIEPVLRSVSESVGKGLMADRLPYIRGKGRLVIGKDVRLSGRSCFYFMSVDGSDPEIIIGDNVFIGNACTFSSARSIRISDNCLISAEVRVHDNDGHPSDPVKRKNGERITQDDIKPVSIGENAWIGAGAVVLKGSRIGKDAIVGSCAVVTDEVSDGAIAVGNPAKILHHEGHEGGVKG